MKLAVVLNASLWFNGSVYTTNVPVIKFVVSFRERVEQLILFAPLLESTQAHGHFELEVDERVRIIALPFYNGVSQMYRSAHTFIPKMCRIFTQHLHSWDVAWLFGPHLLCLLFHWIAKRANKDLFFYIPSNFLQEIQSRHYTGSRVLLTKMLVRMSNWYILRALKQATPVFAIGDELLGMYNVTPGLAFKAYPSLITMEDISPDRAEREHPDFTLICVGRLTPEKGIDVLVESVNMLKNQGIRLKCKLVGTGNDETRMRTMVREKDLEKDIEFIGFVKPGRELFQHYDSADIFVLPSNTEGLPKTLYEAMARGLPIIATNVGGIKEIVVHDDNGLIIPSKNPVALAEAIKRLFDDYEMRVRLGAAGLERAQQYTIDKQRDRMLDIITNTLFTRYTEHT